MQMTGYLHFVDEPWGWPLMVSRSIAPPDGFNVARADTTPLLALAAKLVRPMVPQALESSFRHPYGLWLAMLVLLQGAMAARLAWALGARSRLAICCAATIACTLPAFVMRTGHTALFAHFFLTWGLLLVVVVRTERPTLRRGIEWTALLTLVALVQAYLFAMCATLFATWALTSVLAHRRSAIRAVLATTAASAASVVSALFAIGFFTEPLHWAPHFGEASFNPGPLVLTRFALLNPLSRLVDPDLAYGTGYQYEGYDYLGLGVFGLVAFVLATRRAAVLASLRRHGVLAVVLVLFVAFAASNRVFIGRHLLFEFEVPSSLRTLVSQFRSSGRFVWAPTYALVFYVVAQVAKTGRQGLVVLAAATVLQVVDVAPHFGWVRDMMGKPDAVMVDRSLWDRTFAEHAAVWTFPSFDCVWMLRGGWEDPNYKALYQISYRAAELGKTVNSIHNARPGRDCLEDVRDRESVLPAADTVYIYMRRAATGQILDRLADHGVRCLAFDRGFACSSRFDDEDARAFDAATTPTTTPLGSWIVFGGDGAASAQFEGGAWGIRTPEGAYVGWPAEGSRSTLHFLTGEPSRHSHEVELEVDAEPGNLAPTNILVEGGRTALAPIRLGAGQSAVLRYHVRPKARGRDSWISLDLMEAPFTSDAPQRARLRIKRARFIEHVCRGKLRQREMETADTATSSLELELEEDD